MIALFVFAHQDDEMAAASRIRYERECGARAVCVFLTDGGGGNATAETRNRESTRVLTILGVSANDIHFPGTEIPIHDGELVDHLDEALDRLEQLVGAADMVYCLGWEGGHQDHDASQLVAAAFAKHHAILERCFELPLYHGRGTFGPFFRVLSPLSDGREWQRRRLTFREGLRIWMLARLYPSQRGSWAGLLPEFLVKLVILRRERYRSVDQSRYDHPPHEGSLFYERRFRFSYDRFAAAAAGFVARHFR